MNKFVEGIWRTVFAVVFGGYYQVIVEGRENLPTKGAVIVAPNHMSNNDPPLVGYALPRGVHFMAKEELFRNPFFAFLIRTLGAFPVRRGTVDKLAIRHAMEILKREDVLGMFPEGTRQKPGKLGRFHDGVASMALRTGVPIVPVGVIGSTEMKRGQIVIRIGKPLEVTKAKPTAEAIATVNDRLRESLTYLTQYTFSDKEL